MLTLTATELPRFMGCNAFQSLESVAPFNTDESRAEGDAAHWFVEQVFNGRATAEQLIDKKAPNGIFITPDMAEHCEKYLRDIKGRGAVEIPTSYGTEQYTVNGRADHGAWDAVSLTVDDFKYGWKIVEPEFNWTLISHAIGLIIANNLKPDHIVFRIYQPRPYHPRGNVREWACSYHDLMYVFWPKLQKALLNPSDRVCTGEHCYKCEKMSQCPAMQIAAMNAIDVSEVAFNSKLSNDELSWMLDQLKRGQEVLKQSLAAFEDLAMHRMKSGENIPQYSMQNGLGQTRWKGGMTPDVVKLITGVDCSKKELITPNQAKNAGVPESVIKTLTERPNTGYKMVRADTNKTAENLFGRK